jgi:hypothetical protein
MIVQPRATYANADALAVNPYESPGGESPVEHVLVPVRLEASSTFFRGIRRRKFDARC